MRERPVDDARARADKGITPAHAGNSAGKKLYYKPRAHMPNNILPTEHAAADARNIPLIRRTPA